MNKVQCGINKVDIFRLKTLQNFYDVYREVFDTLASEDYEFLRGKPQAYPSFGDENSSYDDVCLVTICFIFCIRSFTELFIW